MNKEDYVNLEVAKLLKEKGFSEPCYCWYGRKGTIFSEHYKSNHNNSFSNDSRTSMPSLYEAQKWLRQKYRILVNSIYDCCSEKWFFDLSKMYEYPSMQDYSDSIYSSYEESLNEGILEALKLI